MFPIEIDTASAGWTEPINSHRDQYRMISLIDILMHCESPGTDRWMAQSAWLMAAVKVACCSSMTVRSQRRLTLRSMIGINNVTSNIIQ